MRKSVTLVVWLVALAGLAPAAGLSQVLEVAPMVSGDAPQALYGGHADPPDYAFADLIAPVPDDVGTIRGLAGGAPALGTAKDGVTGEYYLVEIWPEFESFHAVRVGSDPIGFPEVEGLAVVAGGEFVTYPLFGASFDDSSGTTTLLQIDPGTGIGTAIGSMSQDVRIVGLASWWDRHGPGRWELYGVSRPHGTMQQPALYRIDVDTGAETWIVDLPETCEGLGYGVYQPVLMASGVHYYAIDVREPSIAPLEMMFYPLPAPSSIVGIGQTYGFAPVLPATWGRIKAQFRQQH